MLPLSRLDVSTTAQLGDALLTLIRHDAQAEALETVHQRRVELFVIRAEGVYRDLLVHLVEHQQHLTEIDQRLDVSEATAQALAVTIQQRDADLRGLVQQGLLDLGQQLVDAQQAAATALAEHAAFTDAQALRLRQSLDQAVQRLATLEAKQFSARLSRLWARLRQILPWLRSSK